MSFEDELDQRRCLSCTRCICEDKCCDVVINGGSNDNVVSEMMVTKFKLKSENTHAHTILPGCKMTTRSCSMSSGQ